MRFEKQPNKISRNEKWKYYKWKYVTKIKEHNKMYYLCNTNTKFEIETSTNC